MIVHEGRLKSTNLLSLEECVDFGLKVPGFPFVCADYTFVFKSCCTHGDDVSFDAFRGLDNSRTGG